MITLAFANLLLANYHGYSKIVELIIAAGDYVNARDKIIITIQH